MRSAILNRRRPRPAAALLALALALLGAAPGAAQTLVDRGTVIQTIDASLWSPPSPDTAGIAYRPDTGELLTCDSEVEEMAIFAGVNLWTHTRTGVVTGTANMSYYALILTGGILGSLMWFNVWFVIWPRQRMAIESAKSVAAGGEADPEAAKQAPVGARASRTNTLFSIPMLFFMGSARHLSLVRAEDPAYGPYLIAVLIIAALLEAGIFIANPLHKQLASVKGTLTSGFVTTLILFLIATTLL